MNDGTLYMWGNKNTYQNFDTVATLDASSRISTSR